jgi:hypothetical protein
MLSVLNCTMGDMKFSFDSDDPQEVERARRCVRDMLKRGYILFVETTKGLRKVTGFNAKNDTYIIADGPQATETPDAKSETPKAKTCRSTVPARGAKATAIAPTAGG